MKNKIFLKFTATKAFLLFAICGFIAYFWQSSGFGFYEDDYAYFSPVLGWDFPSLIQHTLSYFFTWPQGRPLGYFLPNTLFYGGLKLGGLNSAYLIGFLILTLNTFLFYLILRKISTDTFALIGGLAYCLFPADTTRPFLMHALGLQPSLTFLLLASYLYLSGKRGFSYLVVVGSLLTYESPFFVFFGIPLLNIKFDRRFLKEMLSHVLILGGIVLYVFIVRLMIGEGRATQEVIDYLIPLKVMASIFLGPLVSVSMFILGPSYVIKHGNIEIFIGILFFATILFFLLRYLFSGFNQNKDFSIPQEPDWVDKFLIQKLKIPSYHLKLTRLFIIGIVLTGSSYLSSFTHFPPINIFGRSTSVHLSAVFGGSIIMACAGSFLLTYTERQRSKNVALFFLCLTFSLMIGYGNLIQQDLLSSWAEQREFWKEVVTLTPDATDSTVIFYIHDNQNEHRFILTHSWADPIILDMLYKFPDWWKNPPRLIPVSQDWTGQIKQENGVFEWLVPEALRQQHYEVLPESNLIILQQKNGELKRLEGNIEIMGKPFYLKPTLSDAKVFPFDKKPLYHLLLPGL